MERRQWVMESPVGPLYLVASEEGLHEVLWEERAVPLARSLTSDDSVTRILARAVNQLEEYFEGRRQAFDLPISAAGTEFQRRVWEELGKIPYGQTVSYRDVARKLNHGKAFRAVGTANGKNPLSIIVPCHRVIASDGSLGGYAGGLEVKTKLLTLEERRLKSGTSAGPMAR